MDLGGEHQTPSSPPTYIHTYIHIYICIYIYTHLFICIYTYIVIYSLSMHKPYHSSPRRRCTPTSCESKSPQTWHHVFLPTYGRAEADDAQRLKLLMTTPHEPLSKGLEFRGGGARARSLVFERVGFIGYVVFGLWFMFLYCRGFRVLIYGNTAPSSDKDPCASSVEGAVKRSTCRRIPA